MYCACCSKMIDNDTIEWVGLHSYYDVIITCDIYDVNHTYKDCEIDKNIKYPFCSDCLSNGWDEPLIVDGKEWWCDDC